MPREHVFAITLEKSRLILPQKARAGRENLAKKGSVSAEIRQDRQINYVTLEIQVR